MAVIRKIFSWAFIKWVLIIGFFIALCLFIFAAIYSIRVTKDLPSVKALSEYRPPIMTRVHAGDGKLIAEYAEQHRVFVPIESIPEEIQHSFVAAEDQRFYEHDGFDERGFARAMLANIKHKLKGERLEGGSTITQQVAKNFLVGNDRTIARKIREIVIATRIEKALDKDHVLELYLNEIYLGERSYGIAAASLNYFGKSLEKLTLSETAYLAALPKAPNNYDLDDNKDRAINRRNYVLNRLVADGYVAKADAEAAKKDDLVAVDRLTGEQYLAADYFVEEARKKIFSMYGEEELYQGGLSIRTTLDTNLQLIGRRALRNGLEAYDKRYGYRGALDKFSSFDDWKPRLDKFTVPRDIGDWRVALVLDANSKSAKLGFSQKRDEEARPDQGTLALADMKWAAPNIDGKRGKDPVAVDKVIQTGDLILVSKKPKSENAYMLQQVPEVNGGLIAMDPHTGRILSLVGGYSFNQSQFNRATQAYRQPGSAFKPFVYAAAMNHDFTPASKVLDAPFVIKRQDTDCVENEDGVLELLDTDEDGQIIEPDPTEEDREAATEDECERFYKPGNYAEGKFYGLSTLRLGLEKSRNLMTVRLANDIGMAEIMEYGRKFDLYDDPKPELAWVLGAGETTMMRLATAYSMLVNGGKRIDSHILDRVQDGQGKSVFVENDEICEICKQDEWTGQSPPDLPDLREDVIDPVTAYQVTFMLQGVIQNGTGVSIRSLDRPLGGKTGTTNDYNDAWFMGFSPNLVTGVYVGYDNPRTLNNEAGSKAAAPIFKEFMRDALKDKTKVPFRIPEGVSFSPVNRVTGEPSYIGAPEYILEAFKPGSEPTIDEVSNTIRFGSGTDTVFGITPAAPVDDEPEPTESRELPDGEIVETSGEVAGETEGGDVAEGEATPPENEGANPDGTIKPPPPTPPAPDPEDEEEDLDDGLY